MCSSSDFEFSAVISGRFARWLTPSQHPDLHFMFTISLGPRILSYLTPSTSCCTLNSDSFSSRSGAIARTYWMDLFVVVDGKDQRPNCPNAPDKLLVTIRKRCFLCKGSAISVVFASVHSPICFCPPVQVDMTCHVKRQGTDALSYPLVVNVPIFSSICLHNIIISCIKLGKKK